MKAVGIALIALLAPSSVWAQEFAKGDIGKVERTIEVEFANPDPRKNAFGTEFFQTKQLKKNKCFLRPGGTIEIRGTREPLLLRYRNEIKDDGDETGCPQDDTLFFMERKTFNKYWKVGKGS